MIPGFANPNIRRHNLCTCEAKPPALPLTFPALPELHDEGCPLASDNAAIQKQRDEMAKEAA